MFPILLMGLIPGILVNSLIYLYQKKDKSIGELTLPIDILIILCGVFYMVSGCYVYGIRLVPILSVAVNATMLLFTSYTDIRCSQVYVFFADISVVIQALLVIYLFRGGLINAAKLRYFLFYTAIIIIFVFFGLARADGVIYLSCILSFLIVCRTYFELAVLMLLFVSSVMAFILNVKRIWKKEERKKRFPFTSYIAFGCLCSYFVFSFMLYI